MLELCMPKASSFGMSDDDAQDLLQECLASFVNNIRKVNILGNLTRRLLRTVFQFF
jgi:secreted protein with Ig-like and vWFA domain